MGAEDRTQLDDFATVGYQKTYYLEIEHQGDLLNFDDVAAPIARAVKPDGSTYVVPTAAKRTQADYRGQMTVLFASSDLDTAGTWKLDVYIGDSSSAEEPITRRYQFECQAKETEA